MSLDLLPEDASTSGEQVGAEVGKWVPGKGSREEVSRGEEVSSTVRQDNAGIGGTM